MDSLDFNLHQAILSSLARSHASEKQKDKQKAVSRNATHAQVNGVSSPASASGLLSTFGITQEELRETVDWRLSSANAAIAAAQYQCELNVADIAGDGELEDGLLLLLRRLDGIRVERCLGAQGGLHSQHLLPDQLAFNLAKVAITARSDGAIDSLFAGYAALKRSLEEAESTRVIEHVLPCLHGIQRAISSTAAIWTVKHLPAALETTSPLSDKAAGSLRSALTGSFTHSSRDGKAISSVLARYEQNGTPFTGHCINRLDTIILNDIAIGIASQTRLSPIVAWERLRSGSTKTASTAIDSSDDTAVDRLVDFAYSRLEEALEALSLPSDDASVTIDYSLADSARAPPDISLAPQCLRILTAAVCINKDYGRLLKMLDIILSEQSPIMDAELHVSALNCTEILVHRFPDLAGPRAMTIRTYIGSPLTLFWTEEGGQPSQTLMAAVGALAKCIEAGGSKSRGFGVLQAMLVYLDAHDKAGDTSNMSLRSASFDDEDPDALPYGVRSTGIELTQDESDIVTCNTVFTMSSLAHTFKRKDFVRLVLNVLLQHVQTSNIGLGGQEGHSVWHQTLDRVAFMGISNLASEQEEKDFTDTTQAFVEFSRSQQLLTDHDSASLLRSIQLHMVDNLKDRIDFAIIYLRQLLILFIDQCLPVYAENKPHSVHSLLHRRHGTGQTLSQDSQSTVERTDTLRQLLDTLNVIDAIHSLPKFKPHIQKDGLPGDLVLLYRNMWLLSTSQGLTAPKSKDTQLHRSILKRIAVKTPCLIRNTPLNWTETELEYNPLLRREHGTSSEAIRSDLSAILHSTGGQQARAYTYPQTTFLLTVARLESFRAEAGDLSVMLGYFHNEGINASALATPLAEVADRVTVVFNRALGERIRSHAVRSEVGERLQAMVLQTCHAHKPTRQAAIKALDSIFETYPVLLCDSPLLTCILESLTLLRNACECEMDDEYAPAYEFHSERADITLMLPDDYDVRNAMLGTLHQHTKQWLASALSAAPAEMIGLLENYLDEDKTAELRASSSMGHGVALEAARTMPVSAREAGIPDYGGWRADTSAIFSSTFGTRHTYGSEAKTVIGLSREDGSLDTHHVRALHDRLQEISENLRLRKKRYEVEELRPVLYRAAAVILAKPELDYELLREIVFIPVHAIKPSAMHLGVEVWAWLVDRRADVEQKLMVDLHLAWSWTVRRRRGLFSVLLRAEDPINSKTEYSPTDIAAIVKASRTVKEVLTPHRYLLAFLSSRFQAYRYRDRELVLGCMRFVIRSCQRYRIWGKHPLCRELRMNVVTLGFSILNSTRLEASLERTFRQQLYAAALSWFEEAPTWSYGADRLQLQEDIRAMQRLLQAVKDDAQRPFNHITTRSLPFDHAHKTSQNTPQRQKSLQRLLILHVENEIQRLAVWTNPLDDPRRGKDPALTAAPGLADAVWIESVRTAWTHSPRLAVLMSDRFKVSSVYHEVQRLVQADPARAAQVPEALDFFLGKHVSASVRPHLKHLVHWAPVSPISALRYFLPAFNKEPLVLQYAMRVLEQHPVDLVFFYIPQVVQALRTDPLRYMERFIFETSKISQLFCHQMIWNMKANCYKDDLAEDPDPDKEQFESMVDLIIESLSGQAKEFYEKEFGFFNEVTSISRKLMPFVKKTKPEKKEKIDEEMAKIKVEKGVYLPSHPEGQVIDIDRHSGRPLQSHAKTPFMATFQVSREYEEAYSEDAITAVGGEHTQNDGHDGGANEGFPSLQGGESGKPRMKTQETRLSAIFKVGDDCRQDVLAMQVIAQFKNIFNVFGLDLQVQPYRVLATGPGTGIIDVVPNATSRDEMGRAKINDLTSFFLFQFGPAESVAFQKARNNFIQSMAAYSVLCYILQIKDRHNGNIMIDGEGRITHIDFGFLFDIGPGGIKFEPNSFKLTHEMITLMGGKTSQGYRQFCELTVKAFLSCRAYVEDVVSTCQLMMPTDLPSFKGEGTMVRLRERFRPDLTEREAAKYMQSVIDNACENNMSIVYDQFQYFQNKIPYAT